MSDSKPMLAILLAGIVSACASDALHVAQIDTGMTRAQVEQAQGKPDEVESSGDYTALRYGKQYYVILHRDRVVAFGQGRLSRYPGTDRYFINESYP